MLFFFMFILCRNLSKTRDALDSISLVNIDLTFYLKYCVKTFYFHNNLIFCLS